MKNVNGARFQLLLGEADWGRCLHGSADVDPTAVPIGSASEAIDTEGARRAATLLSHQWAQPAGARSTADASPPAAWDGDRKELTLAPRTLELPATVTESPLTLEARRGAAADRHGNVYRIADDRLALRVAPVSRADESTFWPAEPSDCAELRAQERLLFLPHPPSAPSAPDRYLGLAVTADDWLVVAYARGDRRGLLSFDLVAGGQPLDLPWPEAVAFEPFDLCAREGGGVWILDRAHARLWELDCHLAVVRSGQPLQALTPAVIDDFQPVAGPARAQPAADLPAGLPLRDSPAWAVDPIAIESDGQGGVWLLDRDEMNAQSRVVRLRRHGSAWRRAASDWLTGLPGLAHDFVRASAQRWSASETDAAVVCFIATTVGNQAHAFEVIDAAASDGDSSAPEANAPSPGSDGFALRALPWLVPLRRYGGRALAAVRGEGCYDSGLSQAVWTPLVQQPRARYAAEATLITPVFDSGELGITWDKLLIDAAIPAGTSVEVWSRASDELEDPSLTLSGEDDAASSYASEQPAPGAQLVGGWRREPTLLWRPEGPELPWLRGDAMRPSCRASGQGTWELLLQAAQGRYLQLKLRLSSEHGTHTPRLRALRVWSPRFSYPQRFLPAAYREDATSAHFLERWLANFESTFTAIEDKIARATALFDARTVPPEALPWLADWFDLALDPSWDERRHRLLVRHAMDFFRWRGTVHGLRLALELAFDPCFDAAMFDGPRDSDSGARRLRIVETYQTRLIGALAAGDPGAAESGLASAAPSTALSGAGPQAVLAQARWTPQEGNAGLADRWAAWQGRVATPSEQVMPWPLVAPSDGDGTAGPASTVTRAEESGAAASDANAAEWARFCQSALGFVPAAGAQERARWQAWLRGRYGSLTSLNGQHGSGHGRWTAIPLPIDVPAHAHAAADWASFCALPDPNQNRTRWQDFLARRYRRIERLRQAHGVAWPSFEQVPVPDVLPLTPAAQRDWWQFEAQLLPMHRTAHRFSVLLPVDSVSADPFELEQRVRLAERIVALEKPAHTVFEVRLFWSFNRVGEARLGLDTQLGGGSRAPELIPDAVVGRAYVGASFVGGPATPAATDRRLLAC